MPLKMYIQLIAAPAGVRSSTRARCWRPRNRQSNRYKECPLRFLLGAVLGNQQASIYPHAHKNRVKRLHGLNWLKPSAWRRHSGAPLKKPNRLHYKKRTEAIVAAVRTALARRNATARPRERSAMRPFQEIHDDRKAASHFRSEKPPPLRHARWSAL